MVKVFIMLLFGSGECGVEVMPVTFPTFAECWQAGETVVGLGANWESFVCKAIETGNPHE